MFLQLKKTYKSMSTRATSCCPIKFLTTKSVSLVMEMLLLWIYKEELVLVEFLIWTKYLVHMPWQRFDPNMVIILGNQIYLYSSPYYSVEKYIMAYCQEIHLVQTEDSWIVPLDITLREIPPTYVDPSKPGRRTSKRRRGVGESFPPIKNKCSVCRDFGQTKTT